MTELIYGYGLKRVVEEEKMTDEQLKNVRAAAFWKYQNGWICYDELLRCVRGGGTKPYTVRVWPYCRNCRNFEICKRDYGWTWIKSRKQEKDDIMEKEK